MSKQKIKEFMSAFGECSHQERAKILVEAAKEQRRAINSAICGAQSRDLEILGYQKKIQDWNESYGRLYKEHEETKQRLQSENNFLTLKVAELQMQLNANSKPFGFFGKHEILPIKTDSITIADVNLPNSAGSATVLNDDAFEKLKSEMKGREFVSNVNENGHLSFTPKNEPKPEGHSEQKSVIEQIEGVLDDLEVFHNFYLADITKAYNNRNLEENEYKAYISASEAEFNTTKSLIEKLLLNTSITYKKVSKSPYDYTEKLKPE